MINDFVLQYALNRMLLLPLPKHNSKNEHIITFPAIHFSFIMRLNGYITFHAVLLSVAGFMKKW